MMLNYLAAMWSDFAPAMSNHLWQSTLFAVATGLLTLALRKNHARARYWLPASPSLVAGGFRSFAAASYDCPSVHPGAYA
jgi:hypothetical protein